jgi:spore coat polysaccharide biosynthesis protein SpsF (cytidylyltransferase family)
MIMSRVVAIIQARLGSTRLPRKVLCELGGMPSLAWTVRAAKAARTVDDVWLAIPSKDWELAKLAVDMGLGLQCWCGPELDVLRRYRGAAHAAHAGIVVRLTGDCPFLDPWIIDRCVEGMYDSTAFWPDGMDVQVFRPHMLEHGDKEHVVAASWHRDQLPCPEGNLRHVRCTLDTPQDLLDLRAIAWALPNPNRPPTWRETLDAIRGLKGSIGTGKEDHPARHADVFESLE